MTSPGPHIGTSRGGKQCSEAFGNPPISAQGSSSPEDAIPMFAKYVFRCFAISIGDSIVSPLTSKSKGRVEDLEGLPRSSLRILHTSDVLFPALPSCPSTTRRFSARILL
eukprot:Pompholyxophrys_punicea_v1_NODE_60_length_4042_cov_25.567703.p2 type:complete len:110 gc:universal NODE_60_length_4042_cov_25.567703:1532-1203(-)